MNDSERYSPNPTDWTEDSETPNWGNRFCERRNLFRYTEQETEWDKDGKPRTQDVVYSTEFDDEEFSPSDLLQPILPEEVRPRHPDHRIIFTYIIRYEIDSPIQHIEFFRLCNCPAHSFNWSGQITLPDSQTPQKALIEEVRKLPEEPRGKRVFIRFYKLIHNLN